MFCYLALVTWCFAVKNLISLGLADILGWNEVVSLGNLREIVMGIELSRHFNFESYWLSDRDGIVGIHKQTGFWDLQTKSSYLWNFSCLTLWRGDGFKILQSWILQFNYKVCPSYELDHSLQCTHLSGQGGGRGAGLLAQCRGRPLQADVRPDAGSFSLELETNLHEVWSFTITE